jgi:CheY-like chemotaxis protein
VSRILVVEDTDSIAELIQMVLQSRGYELTRDPDGENAVKLAKSWKPDLILLDLNMPRKNGREALEEIRADKNLTHLPVVVMTSSRSEEDIVKSYQLHANCFVTKPLKMEDFEKVVKGLEQFWFSIVTLPPRAA